MTLETIAAIGDDPPSPACPTWQPEPADHIGANRWPTVQLHHLRAHDRFVRSRNRSIRRRAGGRLVFQIFGALAEFERQIIRERTHAGLDAARAKGRKLGRKPALGAKDIQVAKVLLVDPESRSRRLRAGSGFPLRRSIGICRPRGRASPSPDQKSVEASTDPSSFGASRVPRMSPEEILIGVAGEEARQFTAQPLAQTPIEILIGRVLQACRISAPSRTFRRVSLARSCFVRRALRFARRTSISASRCSIVFFAIASSRISRRSNEDRLASAVNRCRAIVHFVEHELSASGTKQQRSLRRCLEGRAYELLRNSAADIMLASGDHRLAIYHLSMKPLSRTSGRSAVAAIAYRAGQKLTNERDGITHDFTAKQGVEHAEIILPDGVSADWGAGNRSVLWNAAEAAEKRRDARVAREFEVALPHELSAEQRIEAAREMAQLLADRYGTAVDFAVHAPHRSSDVRNHHAHLLMTTRQVRTRVWATKDTSSGRTSGCCEWPADDRHAASRSSATVGGELQTSGLRGRVSIFGSITVRMRIAGWRSSRPRRLGVHATQMQRRGLAVSRGRLDDGVARRNAELIREKPEQLLP